MTPSAQTVSEAIGSISYTVTRSSSTGSATVYVSTTTNQGSSNNNDYTGLSNSALSFSSGQTSKTVTINVTNDAVAESTETFGVIVQANSSDPITTFLDSSTFTITDDDSTAVTWSMTPSAQTVSEAIGSISYTVTRSSSTGSATVYVSTTTNQGSSNNNDYTGLSNSALSFSSGQTSKTVTINVTNDAVAESTETFGVIVQANSSDPITTFLDSSTFTITDDDSTAVTWSMTPSAQTVSEAIGSISYTVTRSSSTGSATVYVSTTQNLGSSNSNDYIGLANSALSFTSGQTSRTVTISIIDDTVAEGTETFGVIVQANSGDPVTTFLASSTFTITDNDTGTLPPPTLTSPPNNATGVTTTPTLSWTTVTGANRYWVLISTSPSGFPSDPAATTCGSCVMAGFTAATSHTLPNQWPNGGSPSAGVLSAGVTYYWRVQGFNTVPTPDTYGQYSNTGTFSTAPATGGLPDLIPQINSVSTTTVAPGGTFQMNFSVGNAGTGGAPATNTGIRMVQTNSNSTICGDQSNNAGPGVPTPALLGGAIASGLTATVTAPTTPGTWYACALADNSVTQIAQSNYSNDAAYSQPITVSAGLTATTTQILSNSPNPSQINGGVLVRVRVSSGAGIPTGLVRIVPSGAANTCNLSLSVGEATCTMSFTTAGTYALQAQYLGSAQHAASLSPVVGQTVQATGATVPPILTYSVAPGTAIAPAGATSSVTATPSGGSGTGTAAATTITQCSVNNPAFVMTSPSTLTFNGGTLAPQQVQTSCNRGIAAVNATLSCLETRSGNTPVTRTWPVQCPAATAGQAPTLSYAPATGTTIALSPTGTPTVNGTATSTIQINPTGGLGLGTSNTTTVGNCRFAGAGASVFQMQSAPILAFEGQLAQNLPVASRTLRIGCAIRSSLSSATLTCDETRNAALTSRTWPLTCPAGVASSGLSFIPTVSTPIQFRRQSSSIVEPQTLRFTNPAGSGVSTTITCTASNGFTLSSTGPRSVGVGATGLLTIFAPPFASAGGLLECTTSAGVSQWPLLFTTTALLRADAGPLLGESPVSGVAAGSTAINILLPSEPGIVPTGSVTTAPSNLASLDSPGSITPFEFVSNVNFRGYRARYTPPPVNRGTNLAVVQIQVQQDLLLHTIDLNVYSSPIILIHGLWSDGQSFAEMRSDLITHFAFPPCVDNIHCAIEAFDYEDWNHLVWTNPATLAGVRQVRNGIFSSLLASGTWADRVILVGHSMGGLVSAEVERSDTAATYDDRIRTLYRITLNTPRRGTYLARYLSQNAHVELSCDALTRIAAVGGYDDLSCGIFGSFEVKVGNILGFLGKRVSSAVSGLMVGSPELSWLTGAGDTGPSNRWYGVASVVGTLEGSDPPRGPLEDLVMNSVINEVEKAKNPTEPYCFRNGVRTPSYCVSQVISGYPSGLEANHDGLVSRDSQQFERVGSSATNSLTITPRHHLGAANDSRVIDAVKCAIQNRGSLASCSTDAPANPQRTVGLDPGAEILAIDLASMAKIPVPNSSVQVAFGISEFIADIPVGCAIERLFATGRDGISLDQESPFSVALNPAALGTQTYQIIGICEGNSYFANELQVTVTPPAISNLSMDPAAQVMTLGSGAVVRVTGNVAGTVYDFTPYMVFASGNEAVVTISESGLISTEGLGETTVLASFNGMNATALVTVTGSSESILQNGFEGNATAPEPTYTLGGTVSGMSGNLTLTTGAANTVNVAQNGSFVFPGSFFAGDFYQVLVQSQPPGQNCNVLFGTGYFDASNINAIQVTCTATSTQYTVGGSLSGLAAGQSVTMNNAVTGESLTRTANGAFVFAQSQATGSQYNVSVSQQPGGQICLVSGGSGTISGGSISSILVNCTSSATIPSAPLSLAASAGDAQNNLSWSAPASNGGSAITNYRVFRGTTTTNQQLVTSGGCANLALVTTCADTGLINGQSYFYVVSAVNSVGQGAPSNQVSAIPGGPPTQLIGDPGFETGTPNASWAEASSNFGSPLCTVALCTVGGGTGPQSGTWWTWFGGAVAGVVEIGSVEQLVVIPAGGATITFGFEAPACRTANGANDFVRLLVSGTEVWRRDATAANCNTVGYVNQTVNVSAFATGAAQMIRFESVQSGVGGPTNFFIDNVNLNSMSTQEKQK
jgi:hypothetical protein